MRFISLGSGSRGNATLIEVEGTRLLLDSGFSARELERRLVLADIAADTLDAILVTHEHQDHIKGVGPFARRYRLPVWMTPGTRRADRCGELPELHLLNTHQGRFRIGDIEVEPYPIPHDAREPVQFIFSAGRARLGILTDAGDYTPHILETLQGCDALFLECNHDVGMLADGPYPPALQQRVGGGYGHLSNDQAARFLEQFGHGRLQYLMVGHLSEKNNCPQLVRKALLSVSEDMEERLAIVLQDEVSGWFEV